MLRVFSLGVSMLALIAPRVPTHFASLFPVQPFSDVRAIDTTVRYRSAKTYKCGLGVRLNCRATTCQAGWSGLGIVVLLCQRSSEPQFCPEYRAGCPKDDFSSLAW